MFEKISKILNHILQLIEIKLHENSYRKGLKYLYYPKGSKELIIVFSGFGSSNRRTYNYVRTLKGCKVDRLYILDPWGYMGSYNIYENGSSYPRETTSQLIASIINRGGYNYITTAGSSKGGSCALIFGLEHHVDRIIVGACQYNIGTYVFREGFKPIFRAMMGEDAGEQERDLLDSLIGNLLDKAFMEDYHPEIHVLFSKRELTYERQIKDLLEKLNKSDFSIVLKEEQFEDHGDVGQFFGPYLRQVLIESE